MRAQATKKMAAVLDAEIKKRGSYCIEEITYDRRAPGLFDGVDGFDKAGRPYTGIVRVHYLPEMYAWPKEFGTGEISKMARRAEGQLDRFVDEFLNSANI
jgi:hypothetical protein